jgi:SAM-dependent methyltransferase
MTDPSPGALWLRFRHELRPRLDHDPILLALARASEGEAGDASRSAFEAMADKVYEQVAAFATPLGLPLHAGFYYEDPALAERYSDTQRQVLPQRTEVGERMAAWLWENLGARRRVRSIDLGTGDGSMLSVFAGLRPKAIPPDALELVASDRSAAMLEAHREVFALLGARVMPANAGDLTGSAWSSLATYAKELDGAWGDLAGFDAVMCHSTLHLVPDRARLYAGVRALLAPDGVAVLSCDFLDEEGRRPYVLPEQTIREGYERYRRGAAAKGTEAVTLAGYLGGFLFRRYFLQGDRLTKLSDEAKYARGAFEHCVTERHRRHPEFAILVVSGRPLTEPALHGGSFVRE